MSFICLRFGVLVIVRCVINIRLVMEKRVMSVNPASNLMKKDPNVSLFNQISHLDQPIGHSHHHSSLTWLSLYHIRGDCVYCLP